jgi:hypothetical protein
MAKVDPDKLARELLAGFAKHEEIATPPGTAGCVGEV